MRLSDCCGNTNRTRSWFVGLEADTTKSSILSRWVDCGGDDGNEEVNGGVGGDGDEGDGDGVMGN